jgi:5-methylcytosine-specific restriction endonuclease McrA
VIERDLRAIFDKTSGHCHFCGDPLKFSNRGWTEKPDGHWEVDHVIQRDKGGTVTSENCLPACTRCNRLRWHRTGEAIRELLWLGTIAVKEIKCATPLGKELQRLREVRLEENVMRRQARAKRRKTTSAKVMQAPM